VNTMDMDILSLIGEKGYKSQRVLANKSLNSLGSVNQSLQRLKENGYIDENYSLASKGLKLLEDNHPKNAIILAAGFGLRMIPISTEVPKGLIEINGEKLIERLIKQLNSAGINDITVVVGFLKEHYEYLIDKFGVKLKVNMDYATKNNLFSLTKVKHLIGDTYILPCDIWLAENPFSNHELYSWYLVTDKIKYSSYVRINRQKVLVKATKGSGNKMTGVAYLKDKDGSVLNKQLSKMTNEESSDSLFWEDLLFKIPNLTIFGRQVKSKNFIEINTYEQLRKVDPTSNTLSTDAINIISDQFNISLDSIKDVKILKKGMTNRSFLFFVGDEQYIMRIPGEGTEELINREQEAFVYSKLNSLDLTDEIIYINDKNGFKISKFYSDVRVCDPTNENDVIICMNKLREFHKLNIKVEHSFDVMSNIEFYEKLWGDEKSIYSDYQTTKKNTLSLWSFVESIPKTYSLCHIDSIPDNFLISDSGKVLMIDWEYAGMQDPHIDIAMFAIYSLYEKEEVDRLIEAYFQKEISKTTKLKIYSYISLCGLLWSNWCEYKRSLGVEFGEYSIRQYRYAKEYYRLVAKEIFLEQNK